MRKLKMLLPIALKIIAVIFVSLIIISFLLYLLQESLIFFPQKISSQTLSDIRNSSKNSDEIFIETADNITLHGWFVKGASKEKTPLIIYFGGNAEEVSYMVWEASKLPGWSIALINYRGYGLSEGKPSEANLFKDAETVYDYFSKLPDVDTDRIILMGRSLGTGVAVYLATKRPVKGLILVSPYDSIVSVGKKRMPFVPVGLILKHRFDSISRAPSINLPALFLIAGQDQTIPVWHSKRLLNKWAGQTTLKTIERRDHNNISYSDLYWQSIIEFLNQF